METTLPTRPMLKPWYRLAWADGRGVLEYAGSAVVLEGRAIERLVPALLPLLDGTRTLSEVAAYLGEPAAPAVEQAVSALVRAGVVTEGPAVRDLPRSAAATAELLAAFAPAGDAPAAVASGIRSRRIGVTGEGPLAEEVARVVRLAGVERLERVDPGSIRDGEHRPDAVVAAPSPARLRDLDALNEVALEFGFAWLPVLPFDGCAAIVGPLCVPGETACYRCYRLRRTSTSGIRDELAALEDVPARYGTAPFVAATLAGLGAALALRWLALRDTQLPGRLLAFELCPEPRLSMHHAYRVPRCPACSGLERLAPPSPWSEGEPA